MMGLVGNPAPDFELEGYFKGQCQKYKLSAYRGKDEKIPRQPLISI